MLALARDETYDPFLLLPWQLHGAGEKEGLWEEQLFKVQVRKNAPNTRQTLTK